jgi:hypothetical protein
MYKQNRIKNSHPDEHVSATRLSPAGPAAKDAHGQCHNRPYSLQYTVDGNTDDAEWKKQEPHKRIQNDRHYCQRPAHNEKNAP